MASDPTDDRAETKFFQACRIVFEGGGCRGAAHIGAYEEAVKCGVNVSAVAGTSAGSIVAALIGAGASPEFLVEKCASLKFSALLSEPKNRISPLFGWRFVNRTVTFPLKMLLTDSQRLLRKILLVNGAAYSSTQLQDWLDDLLADLLPETQRPVRFKDLILPTSIVAADLSGKRYKWWSTHRTPVENVSMAVRSSCSIPFFFEPVESGNDFFVDGGILSNLPSFVFAEDQTAAPSLGGRILALRLVGGDTPHTEWTLTWLLRRVIDTMISGATDLQAKLQHSVSTVNIDTGDVSSTDFDISQENVEFLLAQGRKAMHRFVRTEHQQLDDAMASDVARFGEDDLYDDLVREMATAGSRLLVCCDDTRWFWRLYPAVAHWLFHSGEVDILTKPVSSTSGDQRERQRRDFLTKMGARIVCRDDIEPRCFIISRNDDRHDAAFVRDISQSAHAPYGVVYVGIRHRVIISSLRERLSSYFDEKRTKPKPKLLLVPCDSEKLIELLKTGVHQYAATSVTIKSAEVPLEGAEASRVEMIVRRVRTFKYRQSAYLAALYREAGIPFCSAADIRADNQVVSTITPPVFEVWGDKLVTVEGNTRLYYCKRAKAASLSGLVVKGVPDPLPGRPTAIHKALLTTSDVPSSERIDGFNYDRFRSIEGAVRPSE